MKSVDEWWENTINLFEFASTRCGASVQFPMQQSSFLKLEAVLAFIILTALRRQASVHFDLNCSDSGFALPDCRLARNRGSRTTSCGNAGSLCWNGHKMSFWCCMTREGHLALPDTIWRYSEVRTIETNTKPKVVEAMKAGWNTPQICAVMVQ